MTEQHIVSLLQSWQGGDRDAYDRLIALLYPEIKAIARRHMSGERRDHTLQPTGLANEAFLRLRDASLDLKSSNHLKNVIAKTMRRVLVDYARARSREKRGGNITIVTLWEDRHEAPGESEDLLFLDAALTELAEFDELAAELLCLHYFGGLTYREMAQQANLAESTVHAKLRMARAWLSAQAET